MKFTLVFTDQYNCRAARFLGGELGGLHSVSINLSYRITLERVIREQQVVPINVGDHDAFY